LVVENRGGVGVDDGAEGCPVAGEFVFVHPAGQVPWGFPTPDCGGRVFVAIGADLLASPRVGDSDSDGVGDGVDGE
jgi:hypothetical protein